MHARITGAAHAGHLREGLQQRRGPGRASRLLQQKAVAAATHPIPRPDIPPPPSTAQRCGQPNAGTMQVRQRTSVSSCAGCVCRRHAQKHHTTLAARQQHRQLHPHHLARPGSRRTLSGDSASTPGTLALRSAVVGRRGVACQSVGSGEVWCGFHGLLVRLSPPPDQPYPAGRLRRSPPIFHRLFDFWDQRAPVGCRRLPISTCWRPSRCIA
jgi:hypothetical protein